MPKAVMKVGRTMGTAAVVVLMPVWCCMQASAAHKTRYQVHKWVCNPLGGFGVHVREKSRDISALWDEVCPLG